MTSITIITIVVVALLTVIIFGLTWTAYSSAFKLYKDEVNKGKHDAEIYEDCNIRVVKKGILGIIASYIILTGLLGVLVCGIVYKASGENFHINNQTVLVIETGSMSEFYDNKLAEKYENIGYDSSLQFGVGDICLFEKITSDDELVEGEVYGYKQKGIIITHRLVGSKDGMYEFRGDNNPSSDRLLIQRDKVVYHYLGKKVPGIGAFVLYAQSWFGLWSLLGMAGVAVSSEIIYHKVDNLHKQRDKTVRGMYVWW